MKMAQRQLRVAVAIAFCINAFLWQVSESAVVKTNVDTTTSADPCAGFSCQSPRYCELDQESQQPECVCQTICFLIYKPVCGSDGKTYGNTCQMGVAACETNSVITSVYDGTCEQLACSKIRCKHYKVCAVDKKGRAKCACNDACEAVDDPVCGSDGVTYSNACELNATACKSKARIAEQHEGACDDPETDPCAVVRCAEGTRCEVNKRNRAECVCNEVCNRLADPVCGSDGNTYANQCELLRESCQNKKNLTVVCKGECVKEGNKRNPQCRSPSGDTK